MGGNLFDEFPDVVSMADEVLGYSITNLCLEDPEDQLGQTQFTQPALYVVGALHFLKKQRDQEPAPDFAAGHSLGEYNALYSAGAMSFENGLKIVKRRGELMSTAPKGAMAAVLRSSENQIQDILGENDLGAIDIANYNTPSQTVLSGLEPDILRAIEIFGEANVMIIRLKTGGAFHSRYMAPSRRMFTEYLKEFEFSALQFPVISNVHALPYEQDKIPETLSEQLTGSVLWSKSISYLLSKGEVEFEELGSGTVLTGMLKDIRKHVSSTLDTSRTTDDTSKTIEEKVQINSVENRTPGEIVDSWNHTYPKGTTVSVVDYDKTFKTRTEAMVLFGHRVAIYLEGFNGYFALSDVSPVKRDQ